MKRKTTDQFIKDARAVHGDKYDYSKVNYTNNITKVEIICPIHGSFWQHPIHHLSGRGCPECGRITQASKMKSDTKTFVEKAKALHGDKYDYSKVDYIGSSFPIEIICPTHGSFIQRASAHLDGEGCPKCGLEYTASLKRLTTEEFIRRAREVHGDRYDYSLVSYKSRDYVKIICPKHGEFEQWAYSHLSGCGCPICRDSKLELQMRAELISRGIDFLEKETWDWLKYRQSQNVDFYLPKYNVAIECQGGQHFYPIDHFGGEKYFEDQVKRDENKRNLCEQHGIKMVYFSDLSTESEKYEYPYKVYEDIDELFNNEVYGII